MKFNKVAEISQDIHFSRNLGKVMTSHSYYTGCPNSRSIVSMISEPLNKYPSVPYQIEILDSIPEDKKADGSFNDLISKVFDTFGEDYLENQIQELMDANKHLLEIYHQRVPTKTPSL